VVCPWFREAKGKLGCVGRTEESKGSKGSSISPAILAGRPPVTRKTYAREKKKFVAATCLSQQLVAMSARAIGRACLLDVSGGSSRGGKKVHAVQGVLLEAQVGVAA